MGKYMARVPGTYFGQKLKIRMPNLVMDRDLKVLSSPGIWILYLD